MTRSRSDDDVVIGRNVSSLIKILKIIAPIQPIKIMKKTNISLYGA